MIDTAVSASKKTYSAEHISRLAYNKRAMPKTFGPSERFLFITLRYLYASVEQKIVGKDVGKREKSIIIESYKNYRKALNKMAKTATMWKDLEYGSSKFGVERTIESADIFYKAVHDIWSKISAYPSFVEYAQSVSLSDLKEKAENKEPLPVGMNVADTFYFVGYRYFHHLSGIRSNLKGENTMEAARIEAERLALQSDMSRISFSEKRWEAILNAGDKFCEDHTVKSAEELNYAVYGVRLKPVP